MRNTIVLSSILMAVAACASSSSNTTPTTKTVEERIQTIKTLTGNATAGEAVYKTASSPTCISCHQADGKGSNGAPNLAEPSTNDAVEELAGYILNGAGNGKMPKQTALSDQQVADLVAYMKATFKQ